jgi:hypothetical protein
MAKDAHVYSGLKFGNFALGLICGKKLIKPDRPIKGLSLLRQRPNQNCRSKDYGQLFPAQTSRVKHLATDSAI